MTSEIAKENWSRFFEDVSRKRFSWETKIEVIGETTGKQILSNGLYLSGLVFENKTDECEIEISVSDNKKRHQMHRVVNPVRVGYSSDDAYHDSRIEIEEKDGTKTILRIFNPLPIMVGDAAYHSIEI